MMSEFDPSTFNPDWASGGEWAAMYRSYGWQVVPGRSPQTEPLAWKRPNLHSWDEFKHELAPDFTFQRWFGSGGEYASSTNLGVITGEASGGIFMVDLDTYKSEAPAAWWQGLLAVHNNGLDLETPRQTTGGGGVQLFFRAPRAMPTFKTSAGVDVRGQGGYAVLPPSLHTSSQIYAWNVGRAPWECEVLDAPDWLIEAVLTLYGEHGGSDVATAPVVRAPVTANVFGFEGTGLITDGREGYMLRQTLLQLAKYLTDNGALPTPGELFETVWAQYTQHVDLNVPGKDRNNKPADVMHKVVYCLKRAADGRLGTWDEIIARHKELQAGRPFLAAELGAFERGGYVGKEGLYELLDVRAIKALPDPVWLVEGLMTETGLGFVFGPPGCLKTFICLDLALSLATVRPSWWGRKVQRGGAVIYLSVEGTSDLKDRIAAWETASGCSADEAPFYLMHQSISFMNADHVNKLLATIDNAAQQLEVPIAAVFVDTVSRVLPGADENLQKDMTKFVEACDAVRQRFRCVVVGVHHTSRAGAMRGSSVFPGAADFLLDVEREPGAMDGTITADKIKAARDGWSQSFTVTEVPIGLVGGRSSLAVHGDADNLERPPIEPERKLTDNDHLFLKALDRALADGGAPSPASDHIPSKARVVRVGLLKATFSQLAGHLSERSKRNTFDRAWARLSGSPEGKNATPVFATWGEYVWRV